MIQGGDILYYWNGIFQKCLSCACNNLDQSPEALSLTSAFGLDLYFGLGFGSVQRANVCLGMKTKAQAAVG